MAKKFFKIDIYTTDTVCPVLRYKSTKYSTESADIEKGIIQNLKKKKTLTFHCPKIKALKKKQVLAKGVRVSDNHS